MLDRRVVASIKVAWQTLMKESVDLGFESWTSCPRSRSLDDSAIDLLKLHECLGSTGFEVGPGKFSDDRYFFQTTHAQV